MNACGWPLLKICLCATRVNVQLQGVRKKNFSENYRENTLDEVILFPKKTFSNKFFTYISTTWVQVG